MPARHRPAGVALVAALTAAALLPVAADAATKSAYQESYCGWIRSGAKAAVATRISAVDTGRKVVLSNISYATGQHIKCNVPITRPQIGVNVNQLIVRWTITATGWGIESCDIGIPKSFSCTGSGTKQSISIEINKAPGSSTSIALPSGAFFDNGSFGDITKVCSNVSTSYVYKDRPVETLPVTSCVSV